jgi:CheY-like chemotaxis protein
MPKILLVDDNDLFRCMLRKTLLKLGYEVEEATNGREAMRRHSAAPAHLVLTDLIMPDCEGLETIGALRKQDPQVKIVAMSGGGRINARDFLVVARYMGANRTLAKPFSHEELVGTLAELLPPGLPVEQEMHSAGQGLRSEPARE